jgi:hypothetical protein
MKTLLTTAAIIAAVTLPAAADGPFTRGVGVPGSSSKPYGIVGRAVDRAHRDAKGAVDVVPTDQNGHPDKPRHQIQIAAGKGANVGWIYKIFVIHHVNLSRGYAYLQPTLYGRYASEAECETKRAEQIKNFELDRNEKGTLTGLPDKNFIREEHQLNAAIQGTATTSDSTTTGIGSRYVTRDHIESRPIVGPTETMWPSECEPVLFADPDTPQAQQAIPPAPPVEEAPVPMTPIDKSKPALMGSITQNTDGKP